MPSATARAAAERSTAVRERGAAAGTFARGVLEADVVVERRAELENAEQEHREQRQQRRELDEALAALRVRTRCSTCPRCSAPAAHDIPNRTGSRRVAFDLTIVKPLPVPPMNADIGVRQAC